MRASRHSVLRAGVALFALMGPLATVIVTGCRADKPAEPLNSSAVPRRPVVRVEPVQRRTIDHVVEGLGRCEGLPDKIASLTATVEGRVQKLLVLPGANVKAGEPVVELDAAIAAANLAEKNSAAEALEASLRLLQALPRPQEQKNYQLAIDTAKLAVEKAQATVERLRPLRDRGGISPPQMFEAELTLKQAQIQQETAETQFKVAMLEPRPEAVDEAKARIAAVQAAASTAKAQLELYSIRAPIAGRLDDLTCRLGQTLGAGASVGEVIDLSEVYAQVWLPAPEARLVQVGQTAQVRLNDSRSDPLPRPSATDSFAGTVVFAGRVVDPQTGNLPVRILVRDTKGHLALGQTLTAAITVARRDAVLAVPVEAIESRGEKSTVRVLRQKKAVVLQPKLGLSDTHWVEVTGTDLAVGEPVIVDGGYNLPDDAEVTVEPAKAQPRGAEGEPGADKTP